MENYSIPSLLICTKFNNIELVYETLKGWNTDTTGIKDYDNLPEEVKNYIKFIEDYTGASIDLVSVSPDRNDTIERK